MESYKVNLQKFCCNLKRLLSSQAAIIWTTTLPVSSQVRGGFLSQGTGFLTELLRLDVLVANYFSYQVAKRFGFGVLDMHFLFRQRLDLMAKDGVHWMSDAHRDITNILMGYICRALNVVVPNQCRIDRLLRYQQLNSSYNESLMSFQEMNSFCRGDNNEREMSYCEGLYDEGHYNNNSSYADNNWAADSLHDDSLVEWPKRNYRSPDRNKFANWVQGNVGKWQHGPENSSTPNLSHTRIRQSDQYATDSSSQVVNKFIRNVYAYFSDRYVCLSNQNRESNNNWADDSYTFFDESLEEANEGESQQKVVPKKLSSCVSNRINWLDDQHENTRNQSNSYSRFRENWKPYQADDILHTQKSSKQNNNRDEHAFTQSYNNAGNERRHGKRFHQPYRSHNSRQNFGHTYQRSTYDYRQHPY